MKTEGFYCESELHEEGVSRLVRFRENQFTKRETYMRADGRERLYERSIPDGHRCRECVEKEANPMQAYQGRLV